MFWSLAGTPRVFAEQQSVGAGARLVWNQGASSGAELGSHTYILYVDDVPTPLSGASCVRLGGGPSSECIAPLPPLTPGVHRLEVAAAIVIRGVSIESARSAPILVSVAGNGAAAQRVTSAVVEPSSTPVGGNLAVEAIASGFVHATDLAVSNEGLLFVAELGGRLRVVQEGRHSPEAVLPIDDVQRSSRGGLLSLALDPQFARTGLVYLVYAFESSAGDLMYRLARFRYADGVLGERAVLLDEVPAAGDNLAASVRFGPDGKLYVAFGDAGGLRDVPSSFNGKVLRLGSDGTTPRDQPSASPVYVAGLRAPRALAWGPVDNDLWILDASPDGPTLVRASGSASGVIATSHALPDGTTAESMTFYGETPNSGLRGDLLIPLSNATPVLRAQIDPTNRAAVTFLRSTFPDVGAIRVIAVGPTGQIYLGTADMLVRVFPRGSAR
jgi:hypothetical protein